jgi:hypothetical protein
MIKPMRVDFVNHAVDLRVAVLGSLGFATDYIAAKTGLTRCQVLYRLRRAGVRRLDYRNGDSAVVANVVGRAELLIDVGDDILKRVRGGRRGQKR